MWPTIRQSLKVFTYLRWCGYSRSIGFCCVATSSLVPICTLMCKRSNSWFVRLIRRRWPFYDGTSRRRLIVDVVFNIRLWLFISSQSLTVIKMTYMLDDGYLIGLIDFLIDWLIRHAGLRLITGSWQGIHSLMMITFYSTDVWDSILALLYRRPCSFDQHTDSLTVAYCSDVGRSPARTSSCVYSCLTDSTYLRNPRLLFRYCSLNKGSWSQIGLVVDALRLIHGILPPWSKSIRDAVICIWHRLYMRCNWHSRSQFWDCTWYSRS